MTLTKEMLVRFGMVLWLGGLLSCAATAEQRRPGEALAPSPESAAPTVARRVLLVDLGADAKMKQALLEGIKKDSAFEVEEVRPSVPEGSGLLLFAPSREEDAQALLQRARGKMALKAEPFPGQGYDLVVYLRRRVEGPATAAKDEPAAATVPAGPSAEVVYYVTAQKYFRAAEYQVGRDGTVLVKLEKAAGNVRCYPKVTLRAVTENRQLVSEDTIKAESFLTSATGYSESLRLSFPPIDRVRRLEIEVKAYDETGAIILN